MQQIDNSRILQALIRGFFDALYCGLTDYQDSTAKELIQPKKIKEVMTENYEKISVVFNDTLFYPHLVPQLHLRRGDGNAERHRP